MKVKDVVVEDFCNYRLPSMFIVTNQCSFKCDGCQNRYLENLKSFNVDNETLYNIYKQSDLTRAIVIGGLEPFDQMNDVLGLIRYFRSQGCRDVFVIYTGYVEDEIEEALKELRGLENIMIKMGRYDPSKPPYFNKQLGVELASNNQYVILV